MSICVGVHEDGQGSRVLLELSKDAGELSAARDETWSNTSRGEQGPDNSSRTGLFTFVY